MASSISTERSERIAEYVIRVLAAPLVGLVAAAISAVLLGFIVEALPIPGSEPVLRYGCRSLAQVPAGFAFVFAGSLIAPRAWRLGVAVGLVGVGTVLVLYMATLFHSADGEELRLWPPVVPYIIGGLLATALMRMKKYA
jgi:hypothetical protein